MIKNARLSFPNLFQPSSFSPDAPKKFSATFIIEKGSEAEKVVQAEIKKVIAEKWPKGKPGSLKVCVRDGSEKDMDGFGDGVLFFNASNDKRVPIFDRDRTPLTEEDGKPYAGCYVNVMVQFWCQDNQYGKRVNASLLGVQFAGDGDAFGGGARAAAAEDFPVLEATGTDSWLG